MPTEHSDFPCQFGHWALQKVPKERHQSSGPFQRSIPNRFKRIHRCLLIQGHKKVTIKIIKQVRSDCAFRSTTQKGKINWNWHQLHHWGWIGNWNYCERKCHECLQLWFKFGSHEWDGWKCYKNFWGKKLYLTWVCGEWKSSQTLFLRWSRYCSTAKGKHDKQEIVFSIYLLDAYAKKIRYCPIRSAKHEARGNPKAGCTDSIQKRWTRNVLLDRTTNNWGSQRLPVQQPEKVNLKTARHGEGLGGQNDAGAYWWSWQRAGRRKDLEHVQPVQAVLLPDNILSGVAWGWKGRNSVIGPGDQELHYTWEENLFGHWWRAEKNQEGVQVQGDRVEEIKITCKENNRVERSCFGRNQHADWFWRRTGRYGPRSR